MYNTQVMSDDVGAIHVLEQDPQCLLLGQPFGSPKYAARSSDLQYFAKVVGTCKEMPQRIMKLTFSPYQYQYQYLM